jgi:hypothetical protein
MWLMEQRPVGNKDLLETFLRLYARILESRASIHMMPEIQEQPQATWGTKVAQGLELLRSD